MDIYDERTLKSVNLVKVSWIYIKFYKNKFDQEITSPNISRVWRYVRRGELIGKETRQERRRVNVLYCTIRKGNIYNKQKQLLI